MQVKKLYKLQVNKDFKNLIRPLNRKEFLQLEENLISDGCREPIVVWNRVIVDGHNRYEICSRHEIPFAIEEKEFECKEAAIAWICANQLGRRNITEETRKFLIGMQYESEKIVNSRKNVLGVNQYGVPEGVDRNVAMERQPVSIAPTGHLTAQRIAEDNNISPGTVQKYAVYTRALERIGQKAPTLVPKILAGQCKISHKNILELSQMSPEEVKKVARRIEKSQQPFVQYKRSREEIMSHAGEAKTSEERQTPSVKDMPAFDPDAEITGLTLTIPSWASSIVRTRTKANLSIVSKQARGKLVDALSDLQNVITEMLYAIKEE